MKNFILNILLFFIICIFLIFSDYFFYLKYEMYNWLPVINIIKNGRMTNMRTILFIPIYLLLTFSIIYFPKNIYDSILLGFIIFSIYNLFLMILFKDITFYMSFKDIIRGTLLLSFGYYLKKNILKFIKNIFN